MNSLSPRYLLDYSNHKAVNFLHSFTVYLQSKHYYDLYTIRRLAKEYLGNVQSGYDSEGSDVSADMDSGVVSDRLRKERLDAQGKYYRHLSAGFASLDVEKDIEKQCMSGHQVSFDLICFYLIYSIKKLKSKTLIFI